MVHRREQSRSTKDEQTQITSSAVLTNEAVVEPIREDAQIIVQTPITAASDSQLAIEAETPPALIDVLTLLNTAGVRHIRGFGNIVIQIPILLVDTVNFEQLNDYETHLKTITMTNSASIGPIEGTGNIVIQIPVLIVPDLYFDNTDNAVNSPSFQQLFSAIIENIARNSLIRGERNVIIQAPVQLTPNVQHLMNSPNTSTSVI